MLFFSNISFNKIVGFFKSLIDPIDHKDFDFNESQPYSNFKNLFNCLKSISRFNFPISIS